MVCVTKRRSGASGRREGKRGRTPKQAHTKVRLTFAIVDVISHHSAPSVGWLCLNVQGLGRRLLREVAKWVLGRCFMTTSQQINPSEGTSCIRGFL